MVFSTVERCLPSGSETCTSLTSANASAWPDVPQDQICDSTSSCPNRTAPTFFTRKRLTQVSTQAYVAGAYAEVQRWNLTQTFPNPGDGTSAALWLYSITRSAAGGASPMPATVLSGTGVPSRVDGVEDTKGGIADPYFKFRLAGISTETGTDISIAYSARDCTSTSLPSAAESNTRRCFPVWFTPPGGTEPARHWFHKYLVTKVTERDLTNLSTAQVHHHYSYLGSPAWAYDDSPLMKDKYRTWSRWAGYGKVKEVTGSDTAPTSLRTETLYYRGLHGDRAAPSGGTKSVSVTDSDGVATTDHRRLGGQVREEITFNGLSGAEVEASITDSTVLATTATNSSGRKAELLGETKERTRIALAAGGHRRIEVSTSYDSAGYPIQSEDLGSVAVSTDDSCTKTSYARNTAGWVMENPLTVQSRVGPCTAWPATPTTANVIADTRYSYDNLPFGQIGNGLPTKQEDATSVSGGAIVYGRTSSTGYDSLGRETRSPTSSTGQPRPRTPPPGRDWLPSR